ncbi:hypothetical protein [Nocardia cyriacigeorgica]|uniref:hypothetical protein n=1 Tax=Nocardia cyriacigeorgica TaxID=135487 RepID=UPI001485F1B9|nr:hypothetical protein [Nocardia cyriacigeorgica]
MELVITGKHMKLLAPGEVRRGDPVQDYWVRLPDGTETSLKKLLEEWGEPPTVLRPLDD